MFLVEAQDKSFWSTSPSAIRSVTRNLFGELIAAGRMQQAAVPAMMHHSMTRAVTDVSLKSDNFFYGYRFFRDELRWKRVHLW